MRVLLIAPSVDTCYEYVSALGLMNLYIIGKKLGCTMELLDLSRDSYEDGLERILSKQYDLIGISCNFTNSAPSCMRYAKDIKQKYPGTMVIAGGNHATLAPQDLLFNSYDYILYGEAEESFKHFLLGLINNEQLKNLDGLCFAENGEVVKNKPYTLVEDLDNLPFNDFSEFDLEPYFKWAKMRYINTETLRGCIYNCAFCATVRMWGHKIRRKSPQRILAEFEVAKRLKADFVFLSDDDTAVDETHLRDFCNLLISNKVKIAWGTTIGSCSVKEDSTYDLMAESGCIKVNVCIESANPRILKAYRKPYTIEDNRKTCENLIKRGILVHNHGIIGFPTETLRETLNTYLYLIKTSPIWHISVLEPRPGTDYWKDWAGQGDIAQYKLFGKANVILSNKKTSNYFIYRLFALYYFLSPTRIKNALFHKVRGIRYSYWIQYYVAYRTLRENFISFFRKTKSA